MFQRHADPGDDPKGGGITATFFSSLCMLLLLGGLGVVTAIDMFDGPGTPRQERTAPTPGVPSSFGTLKAFPGAAKHYVAERYAFKEGFIAINTAVKGGLFGHSPSTRVMFGRDGVLFLASEGVVDGIQGVPPEPQATDAAWTMLFQDLEQAFTEQGVPLAQMIAPDKHSVLLEAFPQWLRATDHPRVSRIIEPLQAQMALPPVDLVAFFENQRSGGSQPPLYHATDTHWTEHGAALAVDVALAPVLGLDTGSVAHAMSMVAGHGGDLARMIGQQSSVTHMAPHLSRPMSLSCATPEGTPIEIVSLDPLPVRRFRCTNPDAPAGHALVYMDSFGMAAAPRLVQLFTRVDFIWSDVVDMAVVDEISPDIAIRIMVARKLQNGDPRAMLRSVP